MKEMATLLSPATRNIKTQYQIKDEEQIIYEQVYTSTSTKAYDIASYYLPYHLRQSVSHEKLRGLPKRYLIPPSQPSELNLLIACHCTRMESQYAKFFEDMPTTLSLDENNAQTLFMNICEQIFADGVKNWGRAVTIFALAATFATHFANKGLLNIIPEIPKWVQDFFDQYLVDWITEQGGWDDLPKKLGDQKDGPSWSRVLAYGGVVAAAGYLIISNSLR